MRLALASLMMLLVVGCHQTSTMTPTGKEVKVNTGPPLVLTRGETKPFQVDIFRAGFDGAVLVTLTDLPAGVTASSYKQSADGPSVTFQLMVAPTADIVASRNAKIIVTAPDGVNVTHPFPVTVKS